MACDAILVTARTDRRAGDPLARILIVCHPWDEIAEIVAAPPALRALKAAFGIDYGKIDYVLHDGAPVVFDIARTPTARSIADVPEYVAALAAGIDGFLSAGAARELASAE
jgi:hypothetical protein